MRPAFKKALGVSPGLLVFASFFIVQQQSGQPIATPIKHILETEPVAHDADDPAVWIHPTDASKSLIFGTDKDETDGGMFVFNVDGKIVASFRGLKYPNNVDVTGPVRLNGAEFDIAVASEREAGRLRIYAINRKTAAVHEVTGKTEVFVGAGDPELMRPMGVALERTPSGDVFAWLSRKVSPQKGPIGRFKLVVNGDRIDVGSYETYGAVSEGGEIEAMLVVPDGRVFYCDENDSIRMVSAAGDSSVFGKEMFAGEREGLAYLEQGGRKLLLCSDQIEDRSEIEVFDITNRPRHLTTILTAADDTDGIEVTTRPLGSRFPRGALIMMSSKGKNFKVYNLEEVLEKIPTR